MVLEFSWLDCGMPSRDLRHAVARTLEGMYSAEVPSKPFTRVFPAHNIIGMWKFGDPKIRRWRGRMLWESKRVLSGNGEAKTKAGRCWTAADPRVPSRIPKPLRGGLSFLMYLLSTLNQFAKADPEHNSSRGKWVCQPFHLLTGV